MEVKNLKLFPTCPFDEYLEMPGWSYSGIRSQGKIFEAPTMKMNLGTKVHKFLLEPREYDYSEIDIVKPLAGALKAKVGPLMKYAKPELVVTADFIHNGFCMKYKGRIDFPVIPRIIIDFKVSEMPIQKSVPYFGYDIQQSGYALACGCPLALIMSIHPKTKYISIYNVPISAKWWEWQIIQKGEPIL